MEKSEEIERELPTIELSGILFKVDAIRDILIDTEDATNTIHTGQLMQLDDDHYEFVFDRETRKLKAGMWLDRDETKQELIWLRALGVYDTEGAKILLDKHPEWQPKDLPTLEIEGEPFYVVSQYGHIAQVANPFNCIYKMDLRHGFHFDTEKKWALFPHEVELLEAKGELPPHVRFVDPETIRLNTNKAKEVHRKNNQPQKTKSRIKR